MIHYGAAHCRECKDQTIHRFVSTDDIATKNCLVCENKSRDRREMLNHPKAKPFTIVARKRL